MTTIREEIHNYIESQLERFAMIKSEDILKIIEKRIDKKIELIDQEVLDPSFIAINDCIGCIQEKKKAYLDIKDMLNKK